MKMLSPPATWKMHHKNQKVCDIFFSVSATVYFTNKLQTVHMYLFIFSYRTGLGGVEHYKGLLNLLFVVVTEK